MTPTDIKISPINVEERGKTSITPGDTIRIHQKITEKEKTRVQTFEGIVIARKHGTEPGATFTVRRVGSDEVVVEKIFPLHSPTIDKIEIIRKAKTRRAKLYFLREKTQRQVREKLRKTTETPKEKQPEQRQEPKKSEEESEQNDKA